MKILRSGEDDPHANLRTEEELLRHSTDDTLLFYVNRPSVIIGQNQIPEAEADVAFCAANGIAIVRRISGGGAVYHDHGNINYSFITCSDGRAPLDGEALRPILDALRYFGVAAEADPRRGIVVPGAGKISGTASYNGKHRRIFHGTLLYDTDMRMMAAALAGDPALRGRKVASVPSPTVNISSLLPQPAPATGEFLDRLVAFFENYYL